MKKINFVVLAVITFLATACFKDTSVVFDKSLVEFALTVTSTPALGKTYPLINVAKGASIEATINLVAAQRPNPETIKYSVDTKESTAQAGVHYVLADNGSIIIPANSSFGTTKIETKNVANADVILVLVLEGNETVKPSENYKRIGFRIR